jgi:Ni/Fe-hydrogenase b-type cytochrome subunit
MIGKGEEPHYLGHNPLQQLAYTFLYALAAVMVLTGFALYGQANPGGFFATTFAWVVSLCGSLQAVRVVHHVLTWVFVIFVPVHVYLALRVRWVEQSGGVTSMISGGRWVSKDVEYIDE